MQPITHHLRRRSHLQPLSDVHQRRHTARRFAPQSEDAEARALGWEVLRLGSVAIYSVRGKKREGMRVGSRDLVRLWLDDPEKLRRNIRRSTLIADEARAAALARLAAGEEPTGEEMGDLLTADKVTQYIFRRL